MCYVGKPDLPWLDLNYICIYLPIHAFSLIYAVHVKDINIHAEDIKMIKLVITKLRNVFLPQNFTKRGELEAVRCDTKSEILKRGCPVSMIIDPDSTLHKIRDKPLSVGKTPVQIQPQEIRLELRPGQPYTFDFTFKRADGYPVDLYYLMDLSYSMNDDLKNVKNLGIGLLNSLKRITGYARIGFGSFVDKTLLPFTDTNEEKLQKPCPREETECEPAFGYKHVLSLTDDGKNFEEMVSQQRISGNLDTPEGSLDAIMQAVTCVNKIGWGNSTRLLVLATDAGFHMAGDGKLAGILEPNQEACQLDDKNMYIKSNLWDYPSVGQIARKLEEQNIQPIFAVTETVADVYRELSKLIPKSEVGVLSNDSSNVVNLIVEAYNVSKLSSNIIVTHDNLPEDIAVTYKDCGGQKEHSDKGTCNNVNIGKEVTFSVTVKALKCIDEKTFNIGPLGFNEKLTVRVKTRCECECDNELNDKHKHCNKQGSVVCGTCSCNSGFLGQRCECSLGQKDEAALKAQCRKDNSTECEGRGDCECGVCKCHLTEAGNSYYGPHCECDDEHCEKYQNKLCGGNGDCKCGECKCKDGFEGAACHCKKSKDGCITTSGKLAFHNLYASHVLECPEGPNVAAIVGGSLAGVALIGLLILLLIKALIYVKDLKEWKRFEKEQQRRKWADGENPLFQKATTTVANPTFTGDS
uniref:Integrin beta n=1 Tax=Pygocentrus nattereri TaxID=42514 RepID=A0AAR2L253_PYGNA